MSVKKKILVVGLDCCFLKITPPAQAMIIMAENPPLSLQGEMGQTNVKLLRLEPNKEVTWLTAGNALAFVRVASDAYFGKGCPPKVVRVVTLEYEGTTIDIEKKPDTPSDKSDS